MGRKILCESCYSVMNESVLRAKNSMNTCLVCGASLGGNDSDDKSTQAAPEEELITWYYYGFKNSDSYSLRDKPIDLEKFGDTYYLEYTFQAPPEDENGNCDKAKEVLRKKYPNAFAPPKSNKSVNNEPKCPRCGSTHIQLVQRKWSLLSGYRTSKTDRICVNCKHRF